MPFKPFSRRTFLSRAATALPALGLVETTTRLGDAQMVWRASEWKLAEFQKLVRNPARIKQAYDVSPLDGGSFLSSIKNSLNALRFGFGIPEEQIKIVGALHGPANMVNYDDYVWDKYKIGEWLDVPDPASGKPAVRNIFYGSKHSARQMSQASDPDEENSPYQDRSVQALQWRGVEFLSCHTALEEQARILVRRNNLSQPPEAVVKDMLAHTQPGILVVAGMAGALALLQAEGHYTYISA